MVQIRTRPTAIEQVARSVDDAAKQARDAAQAIAERATQELESSDLDAHAIRAGARELVLGSEVDHREVQEARDQERLKSAVLAGVVVFALSTAVFIVAREIARRRRVARTTTLRPPLTPRGMVPVDPSREADATATD